MGDSTKKILPVMLVHGGAGDIPDKEVANIMKGVRAAVLIGQKTLEQGGSALDAVEAAVRCMESNPVFNCGFGSVLTSDGTPEMSAAIMEGTDLRAGAVAIIRDREHPISLARVVMEKTPHILLVDDGASRFADAQGILAVAADTLITPRALKSLDDVRANRSVVIGLYPTGNGPTIGDTVGAVALDSEGHMAAATSTGGLSGQMPGRVGDCPQIGAGTFCNDDMGAVSCTGHGETILKWGLSHSILMRMYLKQDGCDHPQACTKKALKEMQARLKGLGGAIVIAPDGKTGVYCTTPRMAWACVKEDRLSFGIKKGQCESEPLDAHCKSSAT